MSLLEANALRLTIEETARRAAVFDPDLVVVNTSAFDRWICPYPSIEMPSSLLDLIRSHCPSSKLVVIGPHITVFPSSSMEEMPSADIGVIGEPESPVVKIAQELASDKDPAGITGTIERNGSEVVRQNPPNGLNGNLDENPMPLYRIMPLEPYQPYGYFKSELYHFPGLSTFILSSRGCPFSCGFCALYIHRRGFRARSPVNVVDEIELLVNEFGVGVLRFQDPEFSIDRRRTVRICETIIERGIEVAWSAETRYGSVDRDLLELMRDSGCYQLNYGLESASQRILDKVGKKQDVEEAEEAITRTSDIGIHASNNLIFGLPGETQQTLEETLRFTGRMWKLPRVSFARASLSVPYPETLIYDRGVEEGRFEPIHSWKEFSRVLKASGQIDTEFNNLNEVLYNIRMFNREIGRMNWVSSYGEYYWLNPLFIARVAAPGIIRVLRKRLQGKDS